MMKYEIRPFTTDDYGEIASLTNEIYPDRHLTAEQWMHYDCSRPEECHWNHFVAVYAGRIVGLGTYQQHIWMYHPQKFHISVEVGAAHRRQGIGTALYRRLLSAIQPLDPVRLHSRTRDDLVDGVRFLTNKGFGEIDRDWESHLDPATVDLAPYVALEEQLLRQGIVIKTLAELQERDEDYARKLYDLDGIASQDAPSVETMTHPPFEDYYRNVFQRPELLLDAWFIAVRDGQYVGTSNLWASESDAHQLRTGFTGVHPEFRRRGVALALKVRAVAYAQSQGNPTVKTWNNQRNRGMLAINEQLGFVRQAPWITFAKDMTKQQSDRRGQQVTAMSQ